MDSTSIAIISALPVGYRHYGTSHDVNRSNRRSWLRGYNSSGSVPFGTAGVSLRAIEPGLLLLVSHRQWSLYVSSIRAAGPLAGTSATCRISQEECERDQGREWMSLAPIIAELPVTVPCTIPSDSNRARRETR
ncbi:hypothetical protein J6590_010412 [Homalodisca vitripennis]|nr:hypothetical protein J6590_010412 [Homalodisca vitripennis]